MPLPPSLNRASCQAGAQYQGEKEGGNCRRLHYVEQVIHPRPLFNAARMVITASAYASASRSVRFVLRGNRCTRVYHATRRGCRMTGMKPYGVLHAAICVSMSLPSGLCLCAYLYGKNKGLSSPLEKNLCLFCRRIETHCRDSTSIICDGYNHRKIF